MNANLNLPAPISALTFLMALALLMVLAALAIGFGLYRRHKAMRAMLAMAGTVVLSYAAGLLLFSAASLRVVVPRGQEKYFCEIDCHIAYSVVSSRFEPTQEGAGRFVVEMQTRFDPTTIGPNRGNGPLKPGPRVIQLIDDGGRQYRAYAMQGSLLTTALRPGESYRTTLVFDVPSAPEHPLLWVHSPSTPPESLMIGNELSPLHRKVYLQL